MNWVSWVRGPTTSEPLNDLPPPQPPEAEQLLALFEDQLRVTELPLAISVLEALKETDVVLPLLLLLLDWLLEPEEEELPLQPLKTSAAANARPYEIRRPGSNFHFRCAVMGGYTSDDQLNCMDLTSPGRRSSDELYRRRDSTSRPSFVKEK